MRVCRLHHLTCYLVIDALVLTSTVFLFFLLRVSQLGAQRNELFSEMQELLKQQQDEVAACRAVLAISEESTSRPGGVEHASEGESGAHRTVQTRHNDSAM